MGDVTAIRSRSKSVFVCDCGNTLLRRVAGRNLWVLEYHKRFVWFTGLVAAECEQCGGIMDPAARAEPRVGTGKIIEIASDRPERPMPAKVVALADRLVPSPGIGRTAAATHTDTAPASLEEHRARRDAMAGKPVRRAA